MCIFDLVNIKWNMLHLGHFLVLRVLHEHGNNLHVLISNFATVTITFDLYIQTYNVSYEGSAFTIENRRVSFYGTNHKRSIIWFIGFVNILGTFWIKNLNSQFMYDVQETKALGLLYIKLACRCHSASSY